MRHAYALALGIGLVCLTPVSSTAQGSIDGFGALSINRVSSLQGASAPIDFGGQIAVDLVPGLAAIGEVGRLGNVLPTTTSALLSLTPIDFSVSAFYGEGGVRVLAAPRAAVSPYVEATAGLARLNFNIGGLGSNVGSVTRAALSLLNRTEPIAGAGGGVLLRGGPLLVDFGYRYKRVFENDLVGVVLSAGQDLHMHQVRVGLGLTF
jgi:hypothetical protein